MKGGKKKDECPRSALSVSISGHGYWRRLAFWEGLPVAMFRHERFPFGNAHSRTAALLPDLGEAALYFMPLSTRALAQDSALRGERRKGKTRKRCIVFSLQRRNRGHKSLHRLPAARTPEDEKREEDGETTGRKKRRRTLKIPTCCLPKIKGGCADWG